MRYALLTLSLESTKLLAIFSLPCSYSSTKRDSCLLVLALVLDLELVLLLESVLVLGRVPHGRVSVSVRVRVITLA